MNIKKREGEGEIGYFLRSVGMASLSASIGEIVTIPFDTAKVRLQIQKTPEGETPKYKGLIGTTGKVASEEGVMALYSGLSAGLQRQIVFAGLRIGLYVPIRNAITGKLPEGTYPTLGQKVQTGILSGAIAITIANPTDVVKIKLQGQGTRVSQGLPPLYNGSIDCYRKMYAEGGIANFWTGWGPNVARNSIINAAELASYDQYKEMMLKYGILKDGILCHLTCASLAGFNAVCVGSPVDVLKTKMMNAPIGTYKSPMDCIMQTFKGEGVAGFYKGFGPNLGRLASFNCVCFLAFEQVKKMFE